MGIVRKFMFDQSFDVDGPTSDVRHSPSQPDAPGRSEPSYGEGDLAAARAEGFAAGRSAAAAEAQARIDQAVATSEALIAQRLDDLLALQRAAVEATERAAMQAAMAIVRKLFPALSRREGLSEIETVVATALEGLHDEPRLVVRVSDALLDPLKARLDPLAHAAGFDGRLVLLADDAVGPGDCRVEWADGGIERDSERLLRQIDDAARRVLAAAPGASEQSATTNEAASVSASETDPVEESQQ